MVKEFVIPSSEKTLKILMDTSDVSINWCTFHLFNSQTNQDIEIGSDCQEIIVTKFQNFLYGENVLSTYYIKSNIFYNAKFCSKDFEYDKMLKWTYIMSVMGSHACIYAREDNGQINLFFLGDGAILIDEISVDKAQLIDMISDLAKYK